MEYKGYVARVEFDESANVFHGQVLNIRDVITFEGRSVDELRDEFKNSVEDYLEFCAGNTHEGDCAVTRALTDRITTTEGERGWQSGKKESS